MPRVMIVYPNGTNTYGLFEDEGNDPHFVFARRRYEVKEIVETGIFVRTNDENLIERLRKAGVPAKKPEKQCTITISVQPDTKTRLSAAANGTGRSVSSILEELTRKWLEEKGY